MQHLALCVLASLCVLACGPTEEPKTAADAADLGDTTDGLDSDDSSSPGEPSEEAAPGGPASAEDVQAVLQLAIDDPTLLSALRLTEPGRFPLKIAGGSVPRDVELTASSEPVEVVDAPSGGDAAVLVITDLEVTSHEASLKMKYAPERLRARATLEKVDEGWVLVNSSQSSY